MRIKIEAAQRLDISEIPPSARFGPFESVSDSSIRNPTPPRIARPARRRGMDTHPRNSSWFELFAVDYNKALLRRQARLRTRDAKTSDEQPVLGLYDFHDDFIPRLERVLGPAHLGLG